MTELEHAEIVRDEDAGHLLIGIDRPVARKFYTDMSISSIEAETGEAPYLEKLLVFTCFIGGPIDCSRRLSFRSSTFIGGASPLSQFWYSCGLPTTQHLPWAVQGQASLH